MNRRQLIIAASGGAALFAGRHLLAKPGPSRSIAALIPFDHALQAAWQNWKTLCLRPDGRVVDNLQGGASHSESQSYGLTLAAIFDDMDSFDLIRTWTEANLAVRDDALFAWRWQDGQAEPVKDKNNASDGDLFFAWALSAVAVHHKRPELGDRARELVADLVATCVVAHPNERGTTLFLPGAEGFATDGGFVINPSYYMPRAMADLAAFTGDDTLGSLARDGSAMLDQIAKTQLVPDWIEVTAKGTSKPVPRFSSNAGYESIRVPLFAIWSGATKSARVRRFAKAAAQNDPAQPTTVFEPMTGEPIEKSDAAGYQAVAALATCVTADRADLSMPAFSVDQPYYPATLHLMALIAQAEAYPQCVPV
jgi:endoglucanase